MTEDAVTACRNCWDYAEEGALVVQDGRSLTGWRHKSGTVRCSGQEDDDTDDRAEPMRLSRLDAIDYNIIKQS